MPVSQNGWPVNPTRVDLVVDRVAYVGKVRGGDVATVLGHVARQLAARVEPPVAGECWGWAERPIRGSLTGYSNHASATAIDHNAPKHPRGSSGTFTREQGKTIHAILDEVDHVVRWGGDYSSGPVDEMHFEIIAHADAVAKVAARLRDTEEEDDMNTEQAAQLRAIHQGLFVGSSTAGTKAGLIRIEVETQRRVTAGNALLELVAKGQKNLTADDVQAAIEAALEAHEAEHPTDQQPSGDEAAGDEAPASTT